jgi:ATP-dependent helicase/nuclease subunit A
MTAVKAPHKRRDSWTDQQRQAIDTRSVSVALSAGAGCGKTFVLTERFLAHFDPHDPKALQPDEIGKLIAITFTDRAAREMRDRIRRKCYERLLEAGRSDPAAGAYWSALLRALDMARVSTIHSFCGSMLRAHAVEAGLDPRFGVLEQAASDTILAELVDDSLRALLAENDETVLNLLVTFSLSSLRQMLLDLATRRERDQYAVWLAAGSEKLLEAWTAYHAQHAAQAVLRRITASPAANTICALLRDEVSSNIKMQERRRLVLEALDRLRAEHPPTNPQSELESLAENAKVQGAGTAKDWFDADKYEAFKAAATKLRDLAKNSARLLTFDREAARPAAVTSLAVLQVACHVTDAYAARKRELAMLDFDDLLTAAHRLLTDPEHAALRRRVGGQLRLLLVDEFQDTDRVQVELIEALCGSELARGKLFFVGDHKQSIYRFRGAEPRVFAELESQTPAPGQLQLSRNFRSQPAILHFVNALFAGELRNYEPLVPHRPQVSPTPAIEFLWAAAENKSGQKEKADDLRRREADWIARRLRSMLDSGEPLVYDTAAPADKPSARLTNPGDIAILFRAMGDVEAYEKALHRYGIPYYLVGGHAFYAQQEIFDLLNLLRSLVSSADTVALAGVLRSPFFSLADETLFWLAQHADGLGAGLFAEKLPAQLDATELRKAAFAAGTITYLRSIKDQLPVASLINEALDRTGYDAALVAEFLGERKLANLRKLIEQARSFDRAGIFTLADFIEQLSNFVAKQPKEPLAATHPEANDVVKLMSIHQAKGLEFPIVVVPDLGRKSPPDRGRVDFTNELGPMVKLDDEETGARLIAGYELHSLVSEHEDEAESRRLLYVAATRAADYLLLSSGIAELGDKPSLWIEMLDRHFDLLSGKIRGDLPSGWPIPQVRVTTVRPDTTCKPVDGREHVDLLKAATAAEMLASEGQGVVPKFSGPLSIDPAARRQFSFSRLTGELHADEPEQAATAAAEVVLPTSLLDPLGLGTLVHAVLEEIDFAKAVSGSIDLSAIVTRHAERHLPEPGMEVNEAVAMIERMLTSPLAQRLAAAHETYTELEFLLGWPPGEPTSGGVYLRGFIDRLWQDNGGDWHLLDFKTNQVTPASLDRVADKYGMQMLVYALAVERIFGRPPKSLTLHFLRTGDEKQFPWNQTARAHVIKMVDEALANARGLGTKRIK